VTTKPLWRPTIEQLEIIAQMSIARSPVEAIARAVGLSPRAFKALAGKIKDGGRCRGQQARAGAGRADRAGHARAERGHRAEDRLIFQITEA
jgi:hypothetical protein